MKRAAYTSALFGIVLMMAPAAAHSEAPLMADAIHAGRPAASGHESVSSKKMLPDSHKPVEKRIYASPPLPPQSIEGPGGIFINPVAYLVNPGGSENSIGRPAFGLSYARLRDKDFCAATFSVTLVNRVELSYAFNNLQLGDLRRDISRKTGLDIDRNHVQLHHINLRVNLISEGGLGYRWMPAVTCGAHFKYNKHVDSLNHRLNGVLRDIGVHDNHGIDYTLVATKMINDFLPRPVLLTAGIRMTKACHIGLLGFSDRYSAQAELSFAQFLTDRLLLVGEFKSKPDKLREIPGLVEEEDDWWTLALCYILNKHSTVCFGYFNPGAVLNEDVNNGWACRIMFEF